jgi:hypothetical protein
MFWNKLRNYVETVDGYLIKKNEAHKVIISDVDIKQKTLWYRKENAPKYDFANSYLSWGLICQNYYKNNVEVNKDGTPIGYISLEEHERIVEEFGNTKSGRNIKLSKTGEEYPTMINNFNVKEVITRVSEKIKQQMGDSYPDDYKLGKPKKAGRPKGSKNNKK